MQDRPFRFVLSDASMAAVLTAPQELAFAADRRDRVRCT